MLYNGHLVIADTFLRNWPNHGQTLIEKPLYSGHLYSGHLSQRTLFLSTREHFGQNLPFNSGHLNDLLGKKKTHGCFYMTHSFTLT